MLNFPYKSFITEDDVRTQGGYRLSEVIIDDDSGSTETTVANFLREVARIIYDYLPPHRADSIYADPANEEALARCQFYEAIYIIENGDLAARKGDLTGYQNLAKSAYFEMLRNGWLYAGGVVKC